MLRAKGGLTQEVSFAWCNSKATHVGWLREAYNAINLLIYLIMMPVCNLNSTCAGPARWGEAQSEQFILVFYML